MKNAAYCLLLTIFSALSASAQFPPQVPYPGNDAIAADDSAIQGWATACTVSRGWINITDTTAGRVTQGDSTDALGPEDLTTVSLGDGGTATLQFDQPIANGSGPDFAVFENAFYHPTDSTLAFLELAFVEVSSDGTHFVRFPAEALMGDSDQIGGFEFSDAATIRNLAGKYVKGWGTPFDLEELKDEPGLDVNNILYVRLIDVVGTIDPDYGQKDAAGNLVNDPFPTPFFTGGFDLNAIGVLHFAAPASVAAHVIPPAVQAFPNPATDHITLSCKKDAMVRYQLYNLEGQTVLQGTFFKRVQRSVAALPSGVYYLRFDCDGHQNALKLLIRK